MSLGIDVAIDPDLCIGSGDCVRLVPGAFRIDEARGVSVPLEGASSRPTWVSCSEAATGCPTQAIRVVQDSVVLHESN